jgi:CheY-like chemotaxis protein
MSKRRLLLADDSMTIQKVVNLTFADEGIEVFTAGNGAEAIERLPEIAPDLVLADVHMPGLTGYEVCEQIRRHPQFAKIPVMLLVGSFEPFDEAEARRVGANDYLTKPFQSIRQLVQKVSELLNAEEPNGAGDLSRSTPYADYSARTNELGDAGMDDETIEQTTINDFGQTVSIRESDANLIPSIAEPETEIRETTPLSFSDIQEMNSSMLTPLDSNKYAINADTDAQTANNADFDLEQTIPQISVPATTTDFDFVQKDAPHFQQETKTPIFEIDLDDENSLLDLDEEEKPLTAAAPEAENEQNAELEILPSFTETHEPAQPQQTSDTTAQIANQTPLAASHADFPPEVIETIVQKVVERLSDKVIEKIAWEIVPDRFDLIVRKYLNQRER